MRQVALGRQLFAHGHLAVQNGLGQVFGDGLVFGLAAIAQAGGGNQLFKGHRAAFDGAITLFERIDGIQSIA